MPTLSDQLAHAANLLDLAETLLQHATHLADATPDPGHYRAAVQRTIAATIELKRQVGNIATMLLPKHAQAEP